MGSLGDPFELEYSQKHFAYQAATEPEEPTLNDSPDDEDVEYAMARYTEYSAEQASPTEEEPQPT